MNGEKSRAAAPIFFFLGPILERSQVELFRWISVCVFERTDGCVCVCSVPPVCTAPRQNVLCVCVCKTGAGAKKEKGLERAPFGLVRLFFSFFFFSFPRKKLTTFFRFAPDNLVCSPTHRNNPHCLCVCVFWPRWEKNVNTNNWLDTFNNVLPSWSLALNLRVVGEKGVVANTRRLIPFSINQRLYRLSLAQFVIGVTHTHRSSSL